MISHDVIACFLSAGADPEDEQDAEIIAEAVDAEVMKKVLAPTLLR